MRSNVQFKEVIYMCVKYLYIYMTYIYINKPCVHVNVKITPRTHTHIYIWEILKIKLSSWNLYLLLAKQERNQQFHEKVNIALFKVDVGNVQWQLLSQYYVSSLCVLSFQKILYTYIVFILLSMHVKCWYMYITYLYIIRI